MEDFYTEIQAAEIHSRSFSPPNEMSWKIKGFLSPGLAVASFPFHAFAFASGVFRCRKKNRSPLATILRQQRLWLFALSVGFCWLLSAWRGDVGSDWMVPLLLRCRQIRMSTWESGNALGVPTVPLSNGLNIPILGLGTSHQGGYSHEAVVYALQKCGIRHIDTAKRYGCESLLQKAIKESGIERENLWLTTKLWHADYGYDKTKQACLESCNKLGVEYLDLYLIHWPDAQVPGKSSREVRAETWQAMEELYEKGICKSIGVSNFLIEHLEQLREDCQIIPHVNQVEYHPFQRPQELVEYCQSRNIVFEGYCPLAKGEALNHPNVVQLAKKYGRTAAQICIRWSIQNGIVTIPKSTKPERVQENCQVFDFSLDFDDVALLNGMHDGRHVSWDPTSVV